MITFLLILGAIALLAASCGVAYWLGAEHGIKYAFDVLVESDADGALALLRKIVDTAKNPPPTDLDHIS